MSITQQISEIFKKFPQMSLKKLNAYNLNFLHLIIMNGPQRTACFAKGMHNSEQYTFLIEMYHYKVRH